MNDCCYRGSLIVYYRVITCPNVNALKVITLHVFILGREGGKCTGGGGGGGGGVYNHNIVYLLE